MSASQIDGYGQADIGDVFSAFFVDQLFELFGVDVAFKRNIQSGVMSFVSDDIVMKSKKGWE